MSCETTGLIYFVSNCCLKEGWQTALYLKFIGLQDWQRGFAT